MVGRAQGFEASVVTDVEYLSLQVYKVDLYHLAVGVVVDGRDQVGSKRGVVKGALMTGDSGLGEVVCLRIYTPPPRRGIAPAPI